MGGGGNRKKRQTAGGAIATIKATYETSQDADEDVPARTAEDVQRRVKYRARKAILGGNNDIVARSLVYNFDYPTTSVTVNDFNMPESAYQPSTSVDKLYLPRPVVVTQPPQVVAAPEVASALVPAAQSGPPTNDGPPTGEKPEGEKPENLGPLLFEGDKPPPSEELDQIYR